MTLILSVLLGIVACAGLQPSEETVNSVELKKRQISVGMTSEKVRELAGEPDSIVQGRHFDPSSQTGMSFGGQGLADTNSFTWWRYYGESQDVNLKIDEAGYVKEIIVSRYAK
jgi:hypothetical protein